MIVVVEGISAAGKTTYCRQFGEDHWLAEWPVTSSRPDPKAAKQVHARFWADHNAARFHKALEIERHQGLVICDTDPLKIHYAWCMEQAGFPWPDKFANARVFVRKAIAERRLGFADLYLVKRIAPKVAREQKESDPTRRRSNFNQHLALQPYLVEWFTAMSHVLPGQVRWGFPDRDELLVEINSKAPEENPRRFDVSVFDALIERLPG